MFHMANRAFDTENQLRTGAPAVGKAFRVLEAVAAQDEPLGVSEIGRRTGLSKSTVHGLLASLLQEGLLESGAAARGYRLGRRLIGLSQRAKDSAVIETARPAVKALAQSADETVFFGRLVEDTVVVLEREASSRPLALSAPSGSRIPVLAGALGKTYLGEIGPDSARAYVARLDGSRPGGGTVVSPERLLSDARQAASRGYALDRGEYLSGVAAAACCFNWEGAYYFLWIVRIDGSAGPDLDTLGPLVADAAQAVQRSLRDATGAGMAPP